jgi:cyanophycin synthetase
VQATTKNWIIAGVGDRRDEDIKECAKLQDACLIILSYDKKNLRGRTEAEINKLLLEGYQSLRPVTHEIIPKEVEAIKHAINSAEEGSFITALSDVVTNAIEIVQEYLDKGTRMVNYKT